MALQQPTRKTPAGPTGPRITDQCQNTKVGDGADAPKLPTEPTSGFKKIKPPKDTTVVEGDAAIISTIELPGDVLCCKFNEDYSLIAAGCADGSVRVYNSETSEFVSTLTDEETKTNKTVSVTAIEHRPVTKNYPINSCYTCTYVNGLVKCWNYNFNQCIYTIREKRQTYGLAYHPRLPKIITYGDDFKIYLYDEETKIQERVLQASERKELHDGPVSRVFAGCFNPRSNYEFLTGGWDDVVHLWDLRAPHAVRHISGVHLCGPSLDINKRGTEILTCSWRKDDQLQLYDYTTFQLLTTFQPDIHQSKLYCGLFASQDFIVCCGGDPSIFRIVDIQKGYSTVVIHSLPAAVYHVDLGPQKQYKKTIGDEEGRLKSDLARVPKIAFVTGNKLNQVDVY